MGCGSCRPEVQAILEKKPQPLKGSKGEELNPQPLKGSKGEYQLTIAVA